MLKNLIERWKAETPILWVKVRSIAITLSASASAIWAANASMSLNLDHTILSICKYSILSGLIISAGAQLQKNPDPPQ